LETKYGFQVRDLHLVVIHPENSFKNYEKIQMPVIQNEVKILLDDHLSKRKSNINTYFKKKSDK